MLGVTLVPPYPVLPMKNMLWGSDWHLDASARSSQAHSTCKGVRCLP